RGRWGRGGEMGVVGGVGQEVRVCFDADRAGEEAAWRTVEAAGDLAVRLTAVPLPAGRDPGDLAGDGEGLATLRRAVEEPVPLMEWLGRGPLAPPRRAGAPRGPARGGGPGRVRRLPRPGGKGEAGGGPPPPPARPPAPPGGV